MFKLILLLLFDLPRDTKKHRKQAAKYRKRLVEIGFEMKQFSVYEREVRNISNVEKIMNILKVELPDEGLISMFTLPDSVYEKQVDILGKNIIHNTNHKPKLIII